MLIPYAHHSYLQSILAWREVLLFWVSESSLAAWALLQSSPHGAFCALRAISAYALDSVGLAADLDCGGGDGGDNDGGCRGANCAIIERRRRRRRAFPAPEESCATVAVTGIAEDEQRPPSPRFPVKDLMVASGRGALLLESSESPCGGW